MPVTLTNSAITISADKDPTYLSAWGAPLISFYQFVDARFTSWTFNTNYNDNVQSRMSQKDCALEIFNKGNVSGNITLDYTDGHVQIITLTGNTTITAINNFPPTGKAGVLQLRVMQDGTGGRTLTYSVSVDWGDAGAPTITTTASRGDIHTLVTRNAGSNIHGLPPLTGYANL